jgi:hypothetical protein
VAVDMEVGRRRRRRGRGRLVGGPQRPLIREMAAAALSNFNAAR